MIYNTIDELIRDVEEWDLSYLSPTDLGDYPDSMSLFFELAERQNQTDFLEVEVGGMYNEWKARNRDNIIDDLISD